MEFIGDTAEGQWCANCRRKKDEIVEGFFCRGWVEGLITDSPGRSSFHNYLVCRGRSQAVNDNFMTLVPRLEFTSSKFYRSHVVKLCNAIVLQ